MNYNYLDLFSGIGGFALGAYRANLRFDTHCFSEVDSYATRLYKKRFPFARSVGDIRFINTSKLSSKYGKHWVITGGFPCQDISIAGKGAGLAGTKSSLWFEMLRVISGLRPRFVIAENDPALAFRGLSTVLTNLAEIGYDAEWQIISAADMGAPHKRERIWIVAYPNSTWQLQSEGAIKNVRGWFINGGKQVELSNADRVHGKRELQSCLLSETETPSLGCVCTDLSHTNHYYYGTNWGENWATEPAVGRVADGVSNRVVRLRGLGNSIIPQIAELLFRQLHGITTETQHLNKNRG